jgi:hypothetical protein
MAGYTNQMSAPICVTYLRVSVYKISLVYFRLAGGGVQLGPLGTAATDWPIIACPG